MKVLKQAQKSISNGRWWIKADACDVRKGLRESMRGIWEGDEDFGDGLLQQMYSEYKSRKSAVDGIGTANRLGSMRSDLEKVKKEVCADFEFLTEGHKQSNKLYNQVLEKGHSTEKKLMEVGWDSVEYMELLKKANSLKTEIESMLAEKRNGVKIDVIEFKLRMRKYLKDLFLKKRLPAKYLLVFMIADELRNRKPYAVPVQFLPYKSITDSKLIELETTLQRIMEKNGMTVVGMLSEHLTVLPRHILSMPAFDLSLFQWYRKLMHKFHSCVYIYIYIYIYVYMYICIRMWFGSRNAKECSISYR